MWKMKSFCAVLVAALAATAAAQNAPSGSSADVLITLPIQMDGGVKDLQLLRGESFEDAAVGFARTHGLLNNNDDTRVREMIDQLSGLLRGRMEEIQAQEAAIKPQTPKPTLQFSLPLDINGMKSEIKKFEGESVDAAVERYLYEAGYSTDVMRQLYPQLVTLVERKLAEIQPPRKEIFSFSITMDGRQAMVRHFENGDPMEEAQETLLSIGVTDAGVMERAAPQIANAIQQEINRQRQEQQQPSLQPEQPVQPPQQTQPVRPPQQMPLKEQFSIPLTMNERTTILVHYDGYTSRESAMRYLADNGVTDTATINQFLPQLVQIIDNRVAELAKQQAAEEAAARLRAEQEAAANRAAQEEQARAAAIAAAARREPLVRLPITFGINQQAMLEYFEGDSVERTVELFLTQLGIEEGPTFNENAVQLSTALRQQASAALSQRAQQQAAEDMQRQQQQQEQERGEPLVSLPVTLSGRVFDLVYYRGEEPATVANTFCVEKHEVIRAELGLQFDGNQLVECQNLLEQTLRSRITEKQQRSQSAQETAVPQQPPANAQQPVESGTQPATTQNPRGAYVMSLDVNIGGQDVALDVYADDDPVAISRAFCEKYRIDMANVDALVNAIRAQLAQLKK